MAKANKKAKYLIKVTNNPGYCGIGAGSVQFANGQAIIGYGRMVEWFREHDGYSVEEFKEEASAE